METRKAKNFLLNHTCMYEMISMDNSKYLVWKLMFPRSGDTFFTVDKSLDMCSWEKLYSILKRITLQYAVSSELPLSSISVECCEFWYRLTVEKTTMDIQSVHEFCGINIDTNLLHDEVLCVKVYNNAEFEESSTAEECSISCARTPNSMSRKRTYSVASLTNPNATERRISKSFNPTKPSILFKTPTKSTSATNANVTERRLSRSFTPAKPSVSSKTPTEFMTNKNVTEQRTSKSFTPTKPSVSSKTATKFATPKREKPINIESSSGGLARADCSGSHNENISLRYSDDEESENEYEENGSATNSSNSSDGTRSSIDLGKPKKETVEKPKVKMDLFKLNELLKDPKYLNGYCYERHDALNNRGNRTFNVYSVNDRIIYAAFHSPQMVKNIHDRPDCKLFFCYSAEMLQRLHNLTEMQFDGIEAVLMVYINHISDRVRPFGYILVPNKNSVTLSNVLKAINEWLNPDGAVAMTVTKCVTPQDGTLHQAIAETWPQAKLIGCSAEYQKEIKLFARQNKGLKTENAELTRAACFLCYLPEVHIAKGIELIQKRNPPEYAVKLAQYLQTKWIGRPISIYDENIVYRSLTVCNRFCKQMLRNRFSKTSYREGNTLKDCWDFIQFLKSESQINSVQMNLDDTKFGRRWRTSFELNTKKQKDRESYVVRIREQLEINLKTMTADEAISIFLRQMLFYV